MNELPEIVKQLRKEEKNGSLYTNNTPESSIKDKKSIDYELYIKDIVFESSIAANSISDNNGKINHANHSFLELWGYDDKNEVLGKKISYFFKKNIDAISVIESLNKTDKWEGEFLAKRKNGSTFIAKGLATVIRNEKNEKIGYQSSCIDVTNQIKNKEHLEELVKERTSKLYSSEKEKSIILNSTKELFCFYNTELQIIWLNKAAAESVGKKPDDLIGKHCYKFWNKSDKPCKNCPVLLSLKTGKPQEIQKQTPDGRHWYIRGYPIFNENGKIVNLVELTLDITDKIKSDEKRKEFEERYRSLFNDSHDWIYICDFKGKFIDANKSAIEGMGYTKNEIKNLNFKSILDRGEILKAFREAKKLKKTHKQKDIIEYKVKTKTGEKRYIETRASLLYKADNPYAIQGIARDITDKKISEEKLKILNKELEEKVLKRTEEIENLLKQKDEFIDQLSHDLKTPLTPLNTLLPIIRKKTKDKKVQELVDISIKNSNYMKNLVLKTLELARLNSPDNDFIIEKQDLTELIGNVIENNCTIFEKEKIKIVNKLKSKIFVKADKLRIEEVINNLLINAVKYTKNKAEIIIDAKENKKFVTISIRDNGIGMTPKQLKDVFNEFYKSDKSRSDFNSIGLGLPICKRIIERHGGKIWAESPGLNKGSTFYFTIEKSKK